MTSTLTQTAEFADVDHATAQALVKAYNDAKAIEAAGKAAVAAAKAKILEAMAGAEVLRDELTLQEVARNKTIEKNVFDGVKLRKDYPALALPYMGVQYAQTFSVVS